MITWRKKIIYKNSEITSFFLTCQSPGYTRKLPTNTAFVKEMISSLKPLTAKSLKASGFQKRSIPGSSMPLTGGGFPNKRLPPSMNGKHQTIICSPLPRIWAGSSAPPSLRAWDAEFDENSNGNHHGPIFSGRK